MYWLSNQITPLLFLRGRQNSVKITIPFLLDNSNSIRQGFLCPEKFVHSVAAVYDRRCFEKAPLTERRYNHHPGGQDMGRPPRM